jgi:hypothetical protein
MERAPKNWWVVSKLWIIEILIACCLSILSTSLYFQNRYHVFPLGRLNYTALVVPLFLFAVHIVNRQLITPFLKQSSKSQNVEILAFVLVAAGIFAWIQPVPEPDVKRPFHLEIKALDLDTTADRGSQVEIREMKYLNGRRIGAAELSMTGDWSVTDGVIISNGAQYSTLVLSGEAPVGVVLQFRYFDAGGKVQISWQGKSRSLDLMSKEDASIPLVLKADDSFFPTSLPEMASLIFVIFYLAGFSYLATILCVVIIRVSENKSVSILTGLLCLFFLAAIVNHRAAYLDFDQPRTFRDTLAYVETAVQPIDTPAFWMGTRAFTLPLFLKALNTTPQNFQAVEQMNRIRDAQFGLSIISWTLLALALTLAFQQYWLKFAIFAVTLLFSMTLEISIWDSLLLSESISFSMLALTLASWVLLVVLLPRLKKTIFRISLVVIAVLTAVLYSFVRDSNIYFLIMGAVIFLLGVLVNRHLSGSRKLAWVYAGLILTIFFVQNLTITHGNRWQIFIQDHLAMRILHDPQAVTYFEKEGLPLSEELMSTTDMIGYEYQQMMATSPTLQPLRAWIDCCGKQTYMKYLLSTPLKTLLEPIEQWQKLVNGGNLEYRNPKYAFQELPEAVNWFNEIFFPHQGWAVALLGVVSLVGIIDYVITKRQPLWIVVGILFITIYPSMFIVWHGEPLEIERHAAQIGIQWRLAGWLGLVMLIEWISTMILERENGFREKNLQVGL